MVREIDIDEEGVTGGYLVPQVATRWVPLEGRKYDAMRRTADILWDMIERLNIRRLALLEKSSKVEEWSPYEELLDAARKAKVI